MVEMVLHQVEQMEALVLYMVAVVVVGVVLLQPAEMVVMVHKDLFVLLMKLTPISLQCLKVGYNAKEHNTMFQYYINI
jgi:hypothetical protein